MAGAAIIRRGWGFFRPDRLHQIANASWPRSLRLMAVHQVIRWTTTAAVISVAAIAAVASYKHAYALVRAHGEAGWTARLVQLTVDGLIYTSSMVLLDSARRKAAVPALTRWLLGLGIG
jgi:hypothetical protein